MGDVFIAVCFSEAGVLYTLCHFPQLVHNAFTKSEHRAIVIWTLGLSFTHASTRTQFGTAAYSQPLLQISSRCYSFPPFT